MLVEQLILVFHVVIACAIVGLILLQQGKGADMGASFGAGGSQTLFGASGSGNALTRATAILATLFFVTSFGLAIVAKQKTSLDTGASELEQMAEQVEAQRSLEATEQAALEQIPAEIPEPLPVDSTGLPTELAEDSLESLPPSEDVAE